MNGCLEQIGQAGCYALTSAFLFASSAGAGLVSAPAKEEVQLVYHTVDGVFPTLSGQFDTRHVYSHFYEIVSGQIHIVCWPEPDSRVVRNIVIDSVASAFDGENSDWYLGYYNHGATKLGVPVEDGWQNALEKLEFSQSTSVQFAKTRRFNEVGLSKRSTYYGSSTDHKAELDMMPLNGAFGLAVRPDGDETIWRALSFQYRLLVEDFARFKLACTNEQ